MNDTLTQTMKATKRWDIFPGSDFVIVGYDPESADMDRPRGEIIRERFYVVAEDALGYRRAWGGMFVSAEEALEAYALFAPSVEDWDEIEPCYGSEAYAANAYYYESAWEAREREMEMARW